MDRSPSLCLSAASASLLRLFQLPDLHDADPEVVRAATAAAPAAAAVPGVAGDFDVVDFDAIVIIAFPGRR